MEIKINLNNAQDVKKLYEILQDVYNNDIRLYVINEYRKNKKVHAATITFRLNKILYNKMSKYALNHNLQKNEVFIKAYLAYFDNMDENTEKAIKYKDDHRKLSNVINLSCPTDVKQAIKKQSKIFGISLSKMCRIILTYFLKDAK